MDKIYKRVNGAWIDISEENRIVDFVCCVGENTTLTIKRNTDGVTNTAYLVGDGATKDYTKDEAKPWAEYIPMINAIHIGAGVTSLGDYLFAEHTSVKQLTFEDSSAITHLGDRCFWRCQFGGEFAFPGLTDSTMSRAFAVCVNLEAVRLSDKVTAIGRNAFLDCLKLRSVTGLRNVTSVDVSSFMYTPRLTHVDLSPSVCRSIREAAFCLSPAMSNIDRSAWSGTTFGSNACAAANWTSAELAAARAVALPTVRLWDGGFDANYKYGSAAGEEYLRCSWDSGAGFVKRYLDTGCHTVSLSAVFGVLTGKKYSSVGEFWLKEVYAKDTDIGETHPDLIDSKIAELVGLQNSKEVWAKDGLAALKQAIATELSNGKPVICNFWMAAGAGHAVAIIGSDAATDKLIVADGTKTSGTRGIVYEVALEDLIGVNENAHIDTYEVG